MPIVGGGITGISAAYLLAKAGKSVELIEHGIVGGEDRDVGKDENDDSRYAALEEYCRSRFGVSTFTHRWSGADQRAGRRAAVHRRELAREKRLDVDRLLRHTTPRGRTATEFPKRMIEKVMHLDVEAKSVDEVQEGEGKIVASGDCPCHRSRFDTRGEVPPHHRSRSRNERASSTTFIPSIPVMANSNGMGGSNNWLRSRTTPVNTAVTSVDPPEVPGGQTAS